MGPIQLHYRIPGLMERMRHHLIKVSFHLLMEVWSRRRCHDLIYYSIECFLDFYLIMNVAVGGTNGWFPEAQGNKPWLNGSPS